MTEDVVRALGYLCLGTRLKRLGERFQSETDAIISAHGLSVSASQYPCLASLDRLGPLTVGELAQALGVSQPGATRSINLLTRQGLVEAAPAEGDQRRKIVRLTAEGRRVVEIGKGELWTQVAAAVAEICEGLDGPLLSQLAAIEDALAEAPLSRRRKPAEKDAKLP
ncbi:MarR family winged helix-turn-helix transcriptional regulator [Aurantimonas sp. VKM B-3413]|uniref:MarR family winged helix-turn-helix transcriptional regulator n=1 Tax=Aurantimonas sp. VKM B-3413 TaxID=2779401 RepID=UPI001E4481A7|nr:MarR family transcriptional regulator [Aurantimonas sp. VKM B-3413]MCB8836546.1 MarR family transcriptional regulator [Aurantimonas sp. VKM B-3413]